MEFYLEIAKLLVAVIGGVFVAWYWNDAKHRLDQYRYIDDLYMKLLERYFQNPRFGDRELTTKYLASFSGDEALRYFYFAMAVHTLMETIFDVNKGRIPKQWIGIFEYHTLLHMTWLRDNRQVHEPDYVARVFALDTQK